MKTQIIFLVMLLFLVQPVFALNNLDKQGDNVTIRVTPTANGSIDTVTANITINDPDGILLVSFEKMTKNTLSQDFNYTLDGKNTTKQGKYDCIVYAFSTLTDNIVFPCDFEVNPSGKEYIPEITGPLMFGAILTLMFTSILLFIFGWKIELFPMKVFLLILSGLIAIMNLGFVAGSFQEFFSTGSSLSSSFGTLYIIFITLVSASSIFLIIWLLLAGFKLWKIKRGFFVEDDIN